MYACVLIHDRALISERGCLEVMGFCWYHEQRTTQSPLRMLLYFWLHVKSMLINQHLLTCTRRCVVPPKPLRQCIRSPSPHRTRQALSTLCTSCVAGQVFSSMSRSGALWARSLTPFFQTPVDLKPISPYPSPQRQAHVRVGPTPRR